MYFFWSENNTMLKNRKKKKPAQGKQHRDAHH